MATAGSAQAPALSTGRSGRNSRPTGANPGSGRRPGRRTAQWAMPRLRSLTVEPVGEADVEQVRGMAPVCRVAGRPADPQKFAVRVGPSCIDGQGAFAAEAIPARRKIGEIRGEAISVREARRRARGMQRIMIVELSERRAIDASQSADPLRFVNHSCQPNAVLRIRQGRVEFYAMREIPPGAEITVDYGETHHGGTLRCCCGAAGCVGML